MRFNDMSAVGVCIHCLLIASCIYAVTDSPLSADLIGYYPFDFDASDASGSNNHGTPEGDAVAAGPFTGFDGISGAFEFSGAGHVVIPIDINPDVLPQLTVTMWVQPDSAIVDAPGLYKTFGHDDGGWDRTFGLDNRNGEYRYAAFTGGAGPGPTTTTGTEIVDDWTFLAAVWDTNEVRFHADENFVTEGLTNTPSAHTTSAIGNLRPDNFSEGWQGLIDDVRIFDEALSVAEIEEIFLFSGSTTASLTTILTEHQEPHATSDVPADAGGMATFAYDTITNELNWDIDFSNLSGPATGMHFHGPAGLGESAGVVIDIGAISGLTSPSIGSTTLTPTQGDELLAGQWYLNIHTAENGPGEIRGQVLRERPATWQNSIAGLWDARANWSSNPSPNHTVKIQTASSATVIGPVEDTTVRSIAIGTTSDGVAELRLQPGTTVTATELVTVADRGRLVGAGTLLAPLELQDGGELAVLNGEAFQVIGRPRPISGTVNSLGALTFDDPVINSVSGTINASEGQLSFPGNATKDDIGLTNNGTLNLSNIVVRGDVHSPSGSTINVGANVQFDGLVSGAADFPGSGIVTFNGGFDPGDSPASMSIGGGVVFGDQNTLRIEIGGLTEGSEFDVVNVLGEVTLDGLLQVDLIDDFEPALGDSFTVMTFESRNDTLFREVAFPSDDWQLIYGEDHLTLTVVPEPSGAMLLWIVCPWLYWLRRRTPRKCAQESRVAAMPTCRKPRIAATIQGLVFLVLIGGLAVTGVQADLIAFYPFDEDIEDDSGNGHDGMAEGDAQLAGPFTGRDGVSGAAQFSGAGHIVIPLDINPSVYPQFSVTMWVKPDASIVNSPGLYKTFGHDDGGWDRTFGLDNREGEFRYAAFTGGAGPGPTDTTGTPITTDWTFLASVWDTNEQTVTFYANENSITEPLTNTTSAHTSSAIGNLRPDNFAEGWRGLIDDVFIFDHALTEGEIEGFRQPVGDLTITAELHQDQETHNAVGVSPLAGGTASLTLDQGTNVLDWTVEWNDLTGPVTGMHFHGNAAAGADAGVLINIGDIGGLTSPSSGSLALSNDQAEALRDGLWYVNIHTDTNPPGEIRGQLLPLETVEFTNPSGGAWEEDANWTDGSAPQEHSTVAIRPANSMIALGPSADTTVRSLTIGATDDGIAEFRLAGNSFFDALEGIRIANRGRLVANGTIVGPVSIDEGGELAVMSGETLELTGTPRPNAGRISILGDLTLRKNLWNSSTGTVSVVNGTFTVPGNGVADEVGLNGGPLTLTSATINGDVHTADDINITESSTFNGLVSGDANFPGAGTANFLGGYSPGDSPALVSFQGDVVFGSDNTLMMEIGGLNTGSEHDQLDISGSVALAGELRIELIDDFVPQSGNQFVLLNYDTNNGTMFDGVMFPAGEWSINYGATQVTLSFGELLGDFNSDGRFDTMDLDSLVEQIIAGGDPPEFDLTADGLVNGDDITQWLATGASANGFLEPFLPGDTNLDGTVNAADLNNLGISWLQSPNTWTGGDFNADGAVNAEDLNTLGIRWQQSIPIATSTVPEPASGILLLSCILGACTLRRRPS